MIGIGTRYSDFTTASRTAFQHPNVRFVNLNVAGSGRGQARRGDAAGRRPHRAGGAHRRARRATGSPTDHTERLADCRPTGTRVVDDAYHLGHQPLPAQTEVLGALNETIGPDAVVVQAAGSMPGDLQMLWRAEDAEAVPRGVRLLLHGLRDRRRARDQDGRSRARGVRAGRRRLLPDDGQRDRHRRVRGDQAQPGDRAEPRVRLDRRAVGVAGLATVWHQLPLPRPRDAACSTAPSCRSTWPPTPRAWAPTSSGSRPSRSSGTRSPDPVPRPGRPPSTSRPTRWPRCRRRRAGGTCRSPRSPRWTAPTRPARPTRRTRPSSGRCSRRQPQEGSR